MSSSKYRILYIEDEETDAELVKRELIESGISFSYLVINTRPDYVAALDQFRPDLILCDHSLPSFNSFEALSILKEKKLDIPFIVITATMTEDVAVTIVKEGALDYILKDRMKRLPHAVINAIEKYSFEKERKRFVDELYEKEAAAKELTTKLAHKLFQAVKVAGIGIWEYDIEKKVFIADDSLLSLCAIKVSEFDGSYALWLSYVHADDKETYNQKFKEALLNHTDFDLEYRSDCPDSSVQYIKTLAVVQRDRFGTPTHLIGTNQDITKSKEDIEKVKHLANRLLLATDSAGLGIWEWDIKKNSLIWDEGMYQLYNIDHFEFGSVYEGWLSRVHPDDKQRVNKDIQMAIEGTKEYDTEFRVAWNNSSVHYIKASGLVERDDNGKAVRMTGINQDITKSKESEQAIRDSEAKYRSYFENSLDGILFTTPPTGKIQAVNPAACNMFQRTEEELLGMERKELADETDPRLRIYADETARTGKAKAELTLYRKDGTPFPCEVASSIYIDSSGQERNYVNLKDISERKRAEQKVIDTTTALQVAVTGLKKIMDSSVDIICVVDENGRFVEVSAASERIWGYEQAELRGKNYMDLVYEEDIDITEISASVIMSGRPLTAFENRYVHKNGNIIPILWSARWDDTDKLMYCIAKDATEKKRFEKALEDERQQFYDLFLHAPLSIGILNGPNHIFELGNNYFLELIGRKNIVGKPMQKVLPEILDQGVIEILDRVYHTGESFTATEFPLKLDRQRDGKLTEVYINLVYQPYKNEEGKILGVFFFTLDVTEQVLSRKKIEESEQRFRQIVVTAQEGIWTIDENNFTNFVNRKMCDMIGYSTLEIMGRPIHDFMDEEHRIKSYEQIERRKKGISENHDLKFITKNGELLWTNISTNPIFNSEGEYKGALAMITDVTEHKLAEEKMREMQVQLLASQGMAQIGSWHRNITSTDTGYEKSGLIFCSDETLRILGLHPDEELTFGKLLSMVHPDDKNLVDTFSKEITSGTSFNSYKVEHRIIRPDKSIKWVRTDTQVMTDEETGKPLKLIGLIKDITLAKEQEFQIKKHNEERAKMVEDLIVRNKDLEQFAYIVSHNLRAPVANILGVAHLINDIELTESEKDEMTKGLIFSVEKLDEVVNDLNYILQVKKGENNIREKVRFSKLVSDITFSINDQIKSDDIEIQSDFSAIDEFVTSKSYLYSIFYNLISNSIKYRRQNIPCIIAIKSNYADHTLELMFQDNGTGIDLTQRGREVFGLYKRFHTNIEGKGMGLFMVKTHVEFLGGKINIDSKVNTGTTITIRFININTQC